MPLVSDSPTWGNVIALIGVLGGVTASIVAALRYKFDRRSAAITAEGEQAIAAMEGLYDGILMIASDDRIIVANMQARLMTGYSAAEILGMKFWKLIPDRFRERHAAAHVPHYRRNPYPRPMGAGQNLDTWLLTKSGTEVPVLLTLKPIEGAENGMRIIVGMKDKAASATDSIGSRMVRRIGTNLKCSSTSNVSPPLPPAQSAS